MEHISLARLVVLFIEAREDSNRRHAHPSIHPSNPTEDSPSDLNPGPHTTSPRRSPTSLITGSCCSVSQAEGGIRALLIEASRRIIPFLLHEMGKTGKKESVSGELII